MDLRQYLIDTFRYNDISNRCLKNKNSLLIRLKRKILQSFNKLPVRWMAGIMRTKNKRHVMVGSCLRSEELQYKWEDSLNLGIGFPNQN
jgi:hypothetical protein